MKAVLFIHGFSARKEDNEYFINKIKKRKNIDLYDFVLPGHGKEKMDKVSHKDWIDKTEEELLKVLEKYDKVTVVGHSMGCILAVHLASKYMVVEKLVLISPAFIFGNFKQNKDDMKRVLKKENTDNLGSGFEGFKEKIKQVPLSNIIEYRLLANKTKKEINNVRCPVLILQGDIDNLISLSSAKYVYNKLKVKKDFVVMSDVRHQVFFSSKKDIIVDYIYNYIRGGIKYYFTKKTQI